MRTIYLECAMGAAGNMLAAALLELTADRTAVLQELEQAGIPGVTFRLQPCAQCGITGSRLEVCVNGVCEGAEDAPFGHDHGHSAHDHGHDAHGHGHSHTHRHAALPEISALIGVLALPEPVRQNAAAVYRLLAEAESAVHGVPVEQVHFHEVGALDAVADITAVCLLMHRLKAEQIVASPVCTGFGTVRCAHGVLPVPAPATARLLCGVPVSSGSVEGELCTPTGAALLRHFAGRFGRMPAMRLQAVGYGFGGRTFDRPNCVRAFLGEAEQDSASDAVCELACNLDDMTPEAVAFAAQRLLEAGALDVWTQAIGMKKGRPGVMLCCLCTPETRARFEALMLRHTTTLGVRGQLLSRTVLPREMREEQTALGTVRVKRAVFDGQLREKPEFDDLAAIARDNGLTLAEAEALLRGDR